MESSAVNEGKDGLLEALDLWDESRELPPEQHRKLEEFAASVGKRFGGLKNDWWQAHRGEKPLAAIEEKMGAEGAFLAPHSRLQNELREASARSAVAALSGVPLGPAGVLAGYAAYANGTSWDGPAQRRTEELAQKLADFDRGDSRMITEGNSVGQVHRDQLWKTMNGMLDDAAQRAKNGHPTEIGVQYYELTSSRLIGKIADAAKAGNKVRVNLDPGRLSFPSRDAEGDSYFSLDATPDKLRTVLQLSQLKDADIAVSLFPPKTALNSPNNLMHRKVLRIGDRVLVAGMNANTGSGDNIDAGYTLRGPAARQASENLARDMATSAGASLEELWGSQHIERFEQTNLRLGSRGFESLFDALAGPSAPGTDAPKAETLADLEAMAEKVGKKLPRLVELPKAEYESSMTAVINGRSQVQLSKEGKGLLRELIDRTVQATNSEENLQRLDDISLASGRRVGQTRVDIADLPVEREAAAVTAISQAEEFLYMPSFVITRSIASAIVARKDELAAEQRELDVRVVADSGIYPYGGTPNSWGIKHLEDNGIRPRWSKLERTGSHDRKIHAKQLLTDKGELVGSTNFSNKGMRDNWETSVYVHFDGSDERAVRERESSKAQFEELWDTSYELDSRDLAGYYNKDKPELGREWMIEQDRDRAVGQVLRMLFNYERQSAVKIRELLEENPTIAKRRDDFYEQGYSRGDATLKAVIEELGSEVFRETMDALPTSQSLDDLRTEVQAWKAG